MGHHRARVLVALKSELFQYAGPCREIVERSQFVFQRLHRSYETFLAKPTRLVVEEPVFGRMTPNAFGTFDYSRDSSPGRSYVVVHLMEMLVTETEYPESDIRQLEWFLP